MKLKKKLIMAITIMIFVLSVIPLILINLATPHEFMGVMILLFFMINPLAILIVSLMVSKDLKQLWWIPILFCILFLISYWIVLSGVILDLLVYAAIYLIIGACAMLVSYLINVKNSTNSGCKKNKY